jgi:hypothetical protein
MINSETTPEQFMEVYERHLAKAAAEFPGKIVEQELAASILTYLELTGGAITLAEMVGTATEATQKYKMLKRYGVLEL